jgi:methyl-accepting chemotaxis protein
MVALVFLGMGISTVISYLKGRNTIEKAVTGQITLLADSTQKVITSWVRDRKLDIQNWSQQKIYRTAVKDTFVGKAARKSANAQMEELKRDYRIYENICVANTSGDIVASSDLTIIDTLNVNDSRYFQEAVKGKPYFSDAMRSEVTDSPVFVISSPIRENGEIVGVFFGTLDINTVSRQYIDPIRVGETGYAFIYQKNGEVIAHSVKSNILKLNMKDFDFGRQMMEEKEGLIVSTFQEVENVVAFKKDNELGWTVCVVANTDEILSSVQSVGYWNLTVASVIVIFAVIIIFLVAHSIVKPINRSIDGLTEAAEQVASGANEVASSSQVLSAGASEQAASIEETSSSLEEMATRTKQNAGHASEAKSMMSQASEIVRKVNRHMSDMAGAINEITSSSEETSKIIKTIDEIAFQTNLLALNAAVEAARAGEAGAGFAVVADEVRNLALRAADAAKSTADLIENTIKAVQNGNELTQSTQQAFKENIEISGKVGKLVEEIAAASIEQSQGIEQVNRAVAEMDKVVQQVASTAEESASASEEMHAQAEQAREFVKGLVAIVGADGGNSKGVFDRGVEGPMIPTGRTVTNTGERERRKKQAVSKANEVNS